MISIQIIQYPKIPTRANDNKMTMPHHKFPNKTRNQQMYQQQQQPKKRKKKKKKKKKNELTLKSFLDECGA